MRTYVYVDGFNLYYRAVRGTPYKWLDIDALCCHLLQPQNQILCIKYFTAHIAPTSQDPTQHIRQQVYLRALRTLPHLQVILGTFYNHVVPRIRMEAPLGPARPEDFPANPQWVTVLNQEEKGSDVKLAVHMVNDAHLGLYDVAVVISNDSDLAEAFRIVKGERRLKVGLLCPADRPTTSLKRYSSFVRSIDTSALAASQFPETMQDGKGWFHKPSNW